MKTQAELLALFPDYKPTVFYGSMEDDNITPVFTFWDRVELEERLMTVEEIKESISIRERDRLDQHNTTNKQGLLFIT